MPPPLLGPPNPPVGPPAFPPQRSQPEPLTWISWSVFVYNETQSTVFPPIDAINYVTERMEYVGSIHGFPAMPNGYNEGLNKSIMVFKVINECLERAKIEAWEEMKKRIEMEGVDVLKDIMEGGRIFKGPHDGGMR